MAKTLLCVYIYILKIKKKILSLDVTVPADHKAKLKVNKKQEYDWLTLTACQLIKGNFMPLD